MKLSDNLIGRLKYEALLIFREEIKEWDVPKGFDIEQLFIDKYLPMMVDRIEYYIKDGLSYFVQMSLKEEKEQDDLPQKM